jgi:threonine/homoserine/homoserine lactone efflux protein
MNFYFSFKSLNPKFVIYMLSILVTFIANSNNLKRSILAYVLTFSFVTNINVIINLSLISKVSLISRIAL